MSAARLAPVLTLLALVGCGDDGSREPTAGGTGAGPTPGSISVTEEPPGTTVEPTQGGSGNLSTGTGGDADSATGGTTGAVTGGGPKFDLGGTPDVGSMGCGDSGGEPDTMFSYIWIANSGQGTVSKIDTLHAANCGVYGRFQAVG